MINSLSVFIRRMESSLQKKEEILSDPISGLYRFNLENKQTKVLWK